MQLYSKYDIVYSIATNLCIYEVNNTECEACEKGSYYPKAESIAEFYQCSHGILFLMQCPEYTIWHGESLKCIYKGKIYYFVVLSPYIMYHCHIKV